MKITFPQRRICWIAAMAVALLAACSGSSKVRVDQDSHVNFSTYKTFAWIEAKPSDTDAKAEVASLNDQRARASITSALQAKGYTLDEAHPDVRLSYVFNVYERPKQSGMRIGLGAGGASGNVGGGVGVSLPVGKRNETVAAMTLNVIDAARNEQVWVGSHEVILVRNNATDADVTTLVDAIVAKYPAAGK